MGKKEDHIHFFLSLPRWEKSDQAHLEILEKVQPFKSIVTSCEFLDWNSLLFLSEDIRPTLERDIIVLEIKKDDFENLYENLLSTLELTSEEDIFEISSSKLHAMRLEVPRHVNEANARNGVVKRGTDAQIHVTHFKELFSLYRKWSELGYSYLLFGHFGDGHLHFNFLAKADELEKIDEELKELYRFVLKTKGSPFAEHGIGTVKQKFIGPFYEKIQKEMFQYLKEQFDPEYRFFPQGFMKKENSIES